MPSWCGVSETLSNRATNNICKWPSGVTLRWSVVAGLPGWPTSSLIECYESAFAAWSAVSAVRFDFTPNDKTANIAVGSRRIDGQAGVLAEAELPCGSVSASSQLGVWFDTGDHWVISNNPPSGKMDLLRVAIHEFGHSLGIGHNIDGQINSIMDPTVSHIRTLQNWCISQVVMRYGNIVTPDEPDVPGNDLADFLDMLAKCLRKSPKTNEFIERFLS